MAMPTGHVLRWHLRKMCIRDSLYLPAVGVVLMVAEIVRALAPERRLLGAFAGVTLVSLALITVAFEAAYRDRRTFAREAVSG